MTGTVEHYCGTVDGVAIRVTHRVEAAVGRCA